MAEPWLQTDLTVLLKSTIHTGMGPWRSYLTSLEALSPGPEQLQQVLPEPDDVVLPCCDALDVVVVLCLQFPGHSHHSLHALLVCSDVSLNGFMLFRGGLNSRKVKSKVVLRDKGTEKTNTKFKSHQCATKKQKMEVES